MASLLSTLLLFSAVIWISVAAMGVTERAALVDSAIAEVQEEFQDAQAKAQNAKLTPAQRRIREFKKSSKEARAQGMARLRFEDTVKRAEKKIIEQNRKALGQDVEKLSESYAQELVHTPGTVLTMEEMNEIYTATGCEVYADVKINCDATYPNHMRFRTANGQCNNKVYPLYGAAGTRMKRLRKAEYEDGISKVRGFTQLQLPITLSDMKIGPFSPPNPSPRLCSVTIVKDKEINDSVHTHMLMQWGQFMDHDLDSMPEYVENDCPHQCFIPESLEGRCAPFPIPYNDVAVEQFADNCLGFRRSLPACEYNETNLMQARQHFNSITHWIDGSTIYHHDRETQLRLRALIGGLLLVDDVNVPTGTTKSSLPQVDSVDDIMACMELPCFLAGDHRANEQTGLIAMHTLWVREHNYIASRINPNNCPDEQVFQMTRRIVGALIQKIHYFDYLPHLLGDIYYKSLLSKEYHYDSSIDPNIPNAFATAAYRFGHSLVQPVFSRLDNQGDTIALGNLPLVEAFFDLSHYFATGTDPILRGLLHQKARKSDEFINSVLTNQLFAADGDSSGMDLAALNIQRGRDHGLPPWKIWQSWALKHCGFPEEYFEIRSSVTKMRLMEVYGSLDNVDLFVGGLAEKPMPNAEVGPTFACIFINTFLALRNGDRFFFENPDIFDEDQMEELKHVSLTSTICRNTEPNFGKVPIDAFVLGSEVNCDEIPEPNWGKFAIRTCMPPPPPPLANSNTEIISILQSLLNKLETKEEIAAEVVDTAGEDESLLSDQELTKRLEALLNKFKK